MKRDTSVDRASYVDFYDQVGAKYPETDFAHPRRGFGTRYWTVLRELAPFAKEGELLLDVGCNDGVYAIPYCRMGGRAVGIDVSRALIERAQESAAAEGVGAIFRQADIVTVEDLDGAPFDVALYSEVLEHVLDAGASLRRIHSLLRLGGHLLLTTPTPICEIVRLDRHYVREVLKGERLLEAQLVESSSTPLGEYGLRDFLYRHDGYYPRALADYVEQVGFRCRKQYTIGFPFPTFLRGALRAVRLRESWIEDLRLGFDLFLRRLPWIKLLGATNVQLFVRR